MNRNPNPPQNGRWLKMALAGVFALAAASYLTNNDMGPEAPPSRQAGTIAYTDFLSTARQGQFHRVDIQGRYAFGSTASGEVFRTYVPENENLVDRMDGTRTRIIAHAQPEPSPGFGLLGAFGPVLLLIGFWWLMMRNQANASPTNRLGSTGKSKAKLLTHMADKVTFDDVAGIDEAKADLAEIVDFLRDSYKYRRMGAKVPKGVLLSGPPGTGKTLTARAVAGEAGVPFYSVSGSDFVEMYVGVGAARVRDMFAEARKNAPCIVFIDEIDAVGRQRGSNGHGGNDEREQTLNQMLVEMDGFEGHEGVILIGATNRVDILDKALLRPGRFDRKVEVGLPDVLGRERILKVHVRNVPLAPDVDPRIIARGTPGFSGADLANLVNEAALLAARHNKRMVTHADFENAKDKILMGAERRTLAMSQEERELTAYHEAGHAICAMYEDASDPIHKATIVPRGGALGMVMRLPVGDRVSMSTAKLKADLCVAMGGRAAEVKKFGLDRVSTGASGDIKMATDYAEKMVTEWGLSDKVGLVRYSSDSPYPNNKAMSPETQDVINRETRRFIDEAYERAKNLLDRYESQFEAVAQALLEYETLTGPELRDIIEGKPIRQPGQEQAQEKPHGRSYSAVPQVSRKGSGQSPVVN